jgi:hypothetical protein
LFELTEVFGGTVKNLLLLLGVVSAAQATPSFALNTGSATCAYTNFGSTNNGCTNQVVANLPAVGGFQGITFSLNGVNTDGSFQENNPNAITDFEPSFTSQTTVITFTASGVPNTASGGGIIASGASIILDGLFNLGLDTTFSGGGNTGSIAGAYTLSFNLTTGGNSVFGGPVVLSGTNGATDQVSQTAVTTAAINPANSYLLTEILTINWTRTGGTPGLIVTIPEGSLDFNSVPTPEPGVFGLCGTGLALLAWVARGRGAR